jgi:RecD/TraA family predicted helicase
LNDEEVIELNVTPVREMFYNADSNFGIYACEPDDNRIVEVNKRYGTITLKGNCAQLNVKENTSYHVKLIPKPDQKYGMNYEIQSIYEDIKSKNGQRAFLTSVLGESKTGILYQTYPNSDLVDLIKNDQIDVNKTKGIGKKSLDTIKEKILTNIENQKAFEHLSQYGLTNKFINKLVQHFKNADILIQEMEKNPYCITQAQGVGFLKADPLALQMGVNKNSPHRIQSAIQYILEQEASNGGHVYTTTENLLDQVYELIHVNYDEISQQLTETKNIKIIGDRISLAANYQCEEYIANKLLDLLHNSTPLNIDINTFITTKEKEINVQLTDQQKQILINITKYHVNCLCGFAGAGKSFICGFIIKLLDELHIDYMLVSPTAKAAKVLSGYTGKKATTIHRAISLKHASQKQYEDHEITAEFLLIDEASMINGKLCARLLKDCVNENLKVLFVGDPGQLPAIGISQLLIDMTNSDVIPTVKLDKIFRQAEGGILDKATKVRNGELFIKHDFVGIKQFGEDLTLACVPQNKIVSGYKYYYNHYLKYYKPEEISIVTPTNKSEIGTTAINHEIQAIVNPPSNQKEEYLCKYNGITFRTGDYVLNIVNNYSDFKDVDDNKVQVINGDSGKIIKIDHKAKQMIIDLDDKPVIFPFKFVNQLMHAWAISVHRCQGSSNRAIIFIADKANTFILSRNLIYTAITRASKQETILTQAETLNRGIKKKTDMQRRTWLKDLLVEKGKSVMAH